MEHVEDSLLRGAVDLHCHCYPEISFKKKMRVEDVETLDLARQAGMRAVVLKSHLWPTTGQVYQLRQRVSGVEVFGSITLNVSSGGLSVWAVEAAAEQGARVVWMPTWSAANGWTNTGVTLQIKRLVPSLEKFGIGEPLSVLNRDGEPVPAVRAILSLARERGLVVSTGHLSVAESLALGREAQAIGFEKLVFGHPFSSAIGATVAQMQEMAKLGAFIELTALDALFSGVRIKEMAPAIKLLGAEHCILTTDSFRVTLPPPPELLRVFVGELLRSGVSEADITVMVKSNPCKLLDLPG